MKTCLLVTLLFISLFTSVACTKKNPQTGGESSALTPSPAPAAYVPRIGVAVRTGARTCIAIRNENLAPNAPITLVSTMLPQSFSTATIGGPSKDPCPITQTVDPTVYSYDLQGATDQIQKLTPLIAVVGSPATFTMANNNVQADLDQNGKIETFRSCSASDGIYLTAWAGTALTGSVLWNAHYYEASNPGTGPACTPAETATTVAP